MPNKMGRPTEYKFEAGVSYSDEWIEETIGMQSAKESELFEPAKPHGYFKLKPSPYRYWVFVTVEGKSRGSFR